MALGATCCAVEAVDFATIAAVPIPEDWGFSHAIWGELQGFSFWKPILACDWSSCIQPVGNWLYLALAAAEPPQSCATSCQQQMLAKSSVTRVIHGQYQVCMNTPYIEKNCTCNTNLALLATTELVTA